MSTLRDGCSTSGGLSSMVDVSKHDHVSHVQEFNVLLQQRQRSETFLIGLCSGYFSTGVLAAHGKIKTPVITPHETALGVLELTFLDECEPQFAAEGVRWGVVNGREGMHKPMLAA